MTWTSHGHHIDGTIMTGSRPQKVARCGGPAMCEQCSREAREVFFQKAPAYQTPLDSDNIDSIAMSKIGVKAELYSVLREILAQIDVISEEARKNQIEPYQLRTPHGDFVLAPMIAAKAAVLVSIAALE